MIKTNYKIVLNPFCHKLFKSSVDSNRAIIDYDLDQFEAKLNEVYQEDQLVDGYAPFCKHIFIENFTDTPVYYAEVTPENEHLLK